MGNFQPAVLVENRAIAGQLDGLLKSAAVITESPRRVLADILGPVSRVVISARRRIRRRLTGIVKQHERAANAATGQGV
jgi:hypothetical protein